MFLAWEENPKQHSSSIWMDRSKEYDTPLDPWSQVHNIDEGIIQSMIIDGVPWEDYHHRSHFPDYHEDYSSDLKHPSVFDFLSNNVNTVDSEDNSYLMSTSLKNETRNHEDSSFTMLTSLKNETTPFPNQVFDYGLVKSKSRLSKISEVNLHSNCRVECSEAWGACTSICIITLGACKLITSSVTTGFKLVKG